MYDGTRMHNGLLHFFILVLVAWGLIQVVSFVVYVKYTYMLKGLRSKVLENVVNNSQDWNDYKVLLNFGFRYLNAAIPKEKNQSQKKLDVSLVTQCSVNNLHHLIETLHRWNGPISVAVFAPGYHFIHAVLTSKGLRYCYPDREVKLHVVYPTKYPPAFAEKALRLWNNVIGIDNEMVDCMKLSDTLRQIEGFNYALGDIPYPHNTLRNVAKHGSMTEFMFLLDVDVMPSTNIRESFLKYLTHDGFINIRLSWNSSQTVYVTPAFEMEVDAPMPKSKSELIQAHKQGQARVFHAETCPCCHKPTKYDDWLAIPESSDFPVAYEVAWAQSWEPFYISTVSVPDHDERFKQYGYDRISQVCELYVAHYSFIVLTNAFVVHKGLKRQGKFHPQKHEENRKNFKLFTNEFKEDLKQKYPNSSRSCQETGKRLGKSNVKFHPKIQSLAQYPREVK